jgi:hypothetical protein
MHGFITSTQHWSSTNLCRPRRQHGFTLQALRFSPLAGPMNLPLPLPIGLSVAGNRREGSRLSTLQARQACQAFSTPARFGPKVPPHYESRRNTERKTHMTMTGLCGLLAKSCLTIALSWAIP